MKRQLSTLRSHFLLPLTGKGISTVVKISGSMGIILCHKKKNKTPQKVRSFTFPVISF